MNYILWYSIMYLSPPPPPIIKNNILKYDIESLTCIFFKYNFAELYLINK